jgi:hypothetical protein
MPEPPGPALAKVLRQKVASANDLRLQAEHNIGGAARGQRRGDRTSGRLKAAREASLKRAEKRLWDTSHHHHHVNVVANRMPAGSRQVLWAQGCLLFVRRLRCCRGLQ